jgi:hypothetical protein
MAKDDAVLSIGARTDKGQKELAKFEQSEEKVIRKTKKMNKTAHKTGVAHQQATSGLLKFAGGIASIGVAASITRRQLEEVNRVRREAAEFGKEAALTGEVLTQLAAGDPRRLAELKGAARTTFAEGGARTLEDAQQTQFALVSAGFEDQRKFFSDLFGIVKDLRPFIEATSTLTEALGRQEVGTAEQVTSKALAASAFTKFEADKLIQATAEGAQQAKGLNITDEKLLAATTVLSKVVKSPETAGVQMKALLTVLTKKGGFEQLDIKESVEKITERGLSGKQLEKFLGNVRAASAFKALRDNMDQVETVLSAINKGQQENLARQVITSRNQDIDFATARKTRATENQALLATRKIGLSQQIAETQITKEFADAMLAGQNELTASFDRTVSKGALSVLGPDIFTTLFGNFQAAQGMRQIDPRFETLGEFVGGLGGREVGVGGGGAFGIGPTLQIGGNEAILSTMKENAEANKETAAALKMIAEKGNSVQGLQTGTRPIRNVNSE